MAPPSSPFGPAPLQVSGSLFSARVVECDQSVGPMPTPAITLGVELRKGLDASREGSSRTSTFAFAAAAAVYPRAPLIPMRGRLNFSPRSRGHRNRFVAAVAILTPYRKPVGDEGLDFRCELRC